MTAPAGIAPDEVYRGSVGCPQAEWTGLEATHGVDVYALPLAKGPDEPPAVYLYKKSPGTYLSPAEARQFAGYLTAAADWAEHERAAIERAAS